MRGGPPAGRRRSLLVPAFSWSHKADYTPPCRGATVPPGLVLLDIYFRVGERCWFERKEVAVFYTEEVRPPRGVDLCVSTSSEALPSRRLASGLGSAVSTHGPLNA